AVEGAPPLATLGPVTARRALAELTRIVRALGARGLLLLFENAHLVTKLPPARRDGAYTVLRELIDNADGARGLASTRVMLFGLDSLYQGRGSLAASGPLATRILTAPATLAGPPPPHHPFVDLEAPTLAPPTPNVEPRRAAVEVAPLLGALVRASFGVPVVEPLVSTTVGYERIDATIGALFAHSDIDGSVFTLVTGPYGAGKTHLLSHLAARALADRRPLLRLSLERLDVDLGSPQRHLRRLLAQSTLPVDGRPSPLDRLERWCREPAERQRVLQALARIEAAEGPAASVAAKLRRRLETARRSALALERFLGALELVTKTLGANYRQDAYGRLLLWLALLTEVEGCSGPVLIIDEAENLYRPGVSRADRRTALRSLAFYCGGALPRACVVLAVTPEALARLRDEAGSLLDEVDVQRTLLPWEDASMLRRRLALARALDVPTLGPDDLSALAERWRLAHAAVRGTTRDAGWPDFVRGLVAQGQGARALVRSAVERLERSFWTPPA
nr:ATP-binding protein [Polyangiaceae bacterium]